MAAGPSAEFNSSALTELMCELSEEDAMKLLNDLCTRTPSGQLLEMLDDEDDCIALLEALRSLRVMPAGSAARWGDAAAAHVCNAPLRCLVGLARSNPHLLDNLRVRLVTAHGFATHDVTVKLAVPERKKARLAHSDLEGSARSDFQAGQAAADAMDREAQKAAQAAAGLTVETPEAAAAAVQSVLRERGCCVRGIRAFGLGFRGSSLNFMYHESKTGVSRAPGIDENRKLQHLLPANDVCDKFCCERDCASGQTCEDIERVRKSYAEAEGREAKLGVLAAFMWDEQRGQLRSWCDQRLELILGVGAESIRTAAQSAEANRSAKHVARPHGMRAYREQHPPANRTDQGTERRVLEQFMSMTKVMPETMHGHSYRKCQFPQVSTIGKLANDYNDNWTSEPSKPASKVSERVYARICNAHMKSENIMMLLNYTGDHNVCKVCNHLEGDVVATSAQIAAETCKGKDEAFLSTLRVTLSEHKAALAEHMAQAVKVTKFIEGHFEAGRACWTKEVGRSRQATEELGASQFRRSPGLRTVDAPHVGIIDDKSGVPMPHVAKDTTEREAETRPLQGLVDPALSEAAVSSTDHGAGTKDSQSEINQEVAWRLATNRGEKVALSVRDNAALGRNFDCIASLPATLCDHKIYDAFITLFWKEMHGKCDADKLFGLIELLMILYPLFTIDQLLDMCQQVKWCTKSASARLVSPQSMTDFVPMFEAQYRSFTDSRGKISSAVRFTERNPHIMVYFGAHIRTAEQAAAALPEGMYRSYYTKHWRGPGWLSMQQWEDSPIEWVFIGCADPKFIPPLPRLRLMTESEALADIPLDVIKTTLEKHGFTLVSKQLKALLVAQLAAQSAEIQKEAYMAWDEKRLSSRAAQKAPTKLLTWRNQVALLTTAVEHGATRGASGAQGRAVGAPGGAGSGAPGVAAVADGGTRPCFFFHPDGTRCSQQVPSNAANGSPLCTQHHSQTAELRHANGHDYTSTGFIASNGHNSYVKRSKYPEMKSMIGLWHADYDGTPRYYDRQNRLYSRPTPHTGRMPPMAFCNRQQGLPQTWPRPPEDCKPVETAPAFEPIVTNGELACEISRAVTRFNDVHFGHVTKPAYLHTLLAEVCNEPGCIPLDTVVLSEAITPGVDDSRRRFDSWIALQLRQEFSALFELLQAVSKQDADTLLAKFRAG